MAWKGMAIAAVLMGSSYANADSLCDSSSELAEMIMRDRQGGTPMRAVMHAMEAGKNEQTVRLGKELVAEAYRRPLMQSDQMKQQAIVEYGNWAYSMCLQTGSKH